MINWLNDTNNRSKYGSDLMMLPANNFMNWYIDTCMWSFMQLWAAPYRLPGKMGEVEKFTQSVSLNGIKSFNICKPLA